MRGSLRLAGACVALACLPASAPAFDSPSGRLGVSANGPDGTRYLLDVGRTVDRVGKRRFASFTRTVEPPPAAGSTGSVGGPSSTVPVELAPRRQAVVGGHLNCTTSGGTFVYGTAGRGVRKVVAVLADGRRLRLARFAPPAAWRYRGKVVATVLPARVGLMRLRAYGRGSKVLRRYEYLPPRPCRGGDPAYDIPEETEVDRDILDGSVAAALGRAERRWRRARIRSYAMTVRAVCFCVGLRPVRVRVRDNRVLAGRGWTVDRLFLTVRDAIEERPDSLDVRFGRFGVLRNLSVDPDRRISDEEIGYVVRRFRRR